MVKGNTQLTFLSQTGIEALGQRLQRPDGAIWLQRGGHEAVDVLAEPLLDPDPGHEANGAGFEPRPRLEDLPHFRDPLVRNIQIQLRRFRGRPARDWQT